MQPLATTMTLTALWQNQHVLENAYETIAYLRPGHPQLTNPDAQMHRNAAAIRRAEGKE